jgi:S1-C subfamily serine protease
MQLGGRMSMPFHLTGRVSSILLLCSLFLVNCGINTPTTAPSLALPSATRNGSASPSMSSSSYPASLTQTAYPPRPTAPELPGPVVVDYPSKTLGIVYDQALQIVALDPGGPAEQAALQVGDRLVAVNGKAVTTPAEFQQAVRSLLQIADVVIVVRRVDREVMVSVTPGTLAARVSTPTPVPADLYYE